MKKQGYIPEFSGKPADMNAFVTTILKDMSIEQLAYYAVQNYANQEVITQSGYLLPPSAGGGREGVCGISSDFPMTMYLAQSWDKQLLHTIGAALTDERLDELEGKPYNSLYFTAVSDVRVNPLCGRFYEGFSEDPYMTQVLAENMAKGAAGNDEFYLKAQVAMKHFTVYQAEWDREISSNYISCRSFYEWHYPAFLNAVKNANVIGVMTSYGATNEIPNTCSPFINELNESVPYGLYHISDFGADSYLLRGMGNRGLKSYAETGYQIAGLMIKTGSFSNNIQKELVDVDDYVRAVDEGLYGITRIDLEEMIRPQIEIWVRTGYFNQQKYPFVFEAGKNYKSAEHQELARQAAKEGLVLLKNENQLLPLSKQDRILISGQFADLRTQPMYTAETPKLAYAGVTPLEMMKIKLSSKSGSIIYAPELNGKIVYFKDSYTERYLTWNEQGDVLFSSERSAAKKLQIWDWGQQAYSFVDIESDRCLQMNDMGFAHMELRDKNKMMPVFTYEDDENGKKCLRTGAIITSPFTQLNQDEVPFYLYDSKLGCYLEERDGQLAIGKDTGSTARNKTSHLHLEELEIDLSEQKYYKYVEQTDYAIVFIGEEARTNASEMKDRQDMKFGQMQLDAAAEIAKRYPGRTVVVVRSDFPMEMGELHNNSDIGAILYAAYGGQYDAEAIADCLLGKISPAGRLTSSWLKSHRELPVRSHSVEADDQYCIDMKAVDAEEYKLTYRYMDEDKWQYPFGFGLSYSEIRYENVELICQDHHYYLQVYLYNSGQYVTDEIVQVYGKIHKSGYGMHVPKRQLIAFERVRDIYPNNERIISIEIDLNAFKIWDAAQNKYILEQGYYTIYVGRDCTNICWSHMIKLGNEKLGSLDLSEFRNIWTISSAMSKMKGVEVSKQRTALRKDAGNYFAVESMDSNAYLLLHNVLLKKSTIIELNAVLIGIDAAYITVRANSLDGDKIAEINIINHSNKEYYLGKEKSIKIFEPEYEIYRERFSSEYEENVDLYFVFEKGGVRIETIRLI